MSARIPVGGLRRRLTIESPVDTADDNGGAGRAYAVAGEAWARVTPLRMEHRFLAGREEQRVTHHVVLRFRDDIETGARFRDRDRIFRVLAVEDADERRTYLRALCEDRKSTRLNSSH